MARNGVLDPRALGYQREKSVDHPLHQAYAQATWSGRVE